MAKVYVKFNSAVVKEVDISKDETTFGRKEGNDIVIDNPAISGFHGKIIKQGDQFFIEDLNSTNGTFINGQRIKKSPLKNRDQVSIARHVLEFILDGSIPTLAEQLSEISMKKEEIKPPAEPSPEKVVAVISESSVVKATPKISPETNPVKPVPEAVVPPQQPAANPTIKVLSGGTGATEYTLKDLVSYIGSADQSLIKLKGLLAPSIAAAISRRPEGYFLKPVKAGSAKVNGTVISDQAFLEHGSQIEVAGLVLLFQNPAQKKATESEPSKDGK